LRRIAGVLIICTAMSIAFAPGCETNGGIIPSVQVQVPTSTPKPTPTPRPTQTATATPAPSPSPTSTTSPARADSIRRYSV
jgi:hypothetical protein